MTNIERTNTELNEQPRIVCAGFVVDGDCRFLSHHDSMRLMELAVFRAGLPVSLSGGFNPRPKLSLPLPRPVGMASRDEILILRIASETDLDEIPARLNEQCPDQIRFQWCKALESRKVAVLSARHEVRLDEDEIEQVAKAVADLNKLDNWHVSRRKTASALTTIDIKPLITHLELKENGILVFELVCLDGRWAKSTELFKLLGLDGRLMTARTTRYAVQRQMQYLTD